MKKILLVLLFLIFANAFSQVAYKYYEVPSGTTNDLNDISIFKSSYPYLFYICGNNGTLLSLAGADSNIRAIQTGVTFNLNSFFKFRETYLYPAMFFANEGMLLYSSNSGTNWYQRNTGYPNNMHSGVQLKAGSPYYRTVAVGSNGIIIYRKHFPVNDTNWKIVQSGTASSLNSICTYDYSSSILWVAGNDGIILRSIDTGNTWSKMISGTTNDLNSIYFKTQTNGYAVGDGGIILKTINGGLNWVQKNSNTVQNLNNIAGYNDSTIYIAGNKVVLISTNKGESWSIDTAAPKYNLNSVNYLYSEYYRKNIPFFTGDGGKVYKRLLDTTFHPNIDVKLDGNNISSSFINTGLFDVGRSNYGHRSGFEWPKGSGKTAVYTAGLCIGAFVNNQLKQVSASYTGEYSPGYCEHGSYKTSSIFKFYKISRGDNAQTNWDWANWGLMVPYGAPFIDVNNNGRYEPEIDTPGVKNASQTIFYCMTDADPNSHSAGEGFGGGTLPLGAEVHLTAWVYDSPGLQDVQFIHFSIINKSDSVWKKVKTGLFFDSDLGDSNDDYSGCDTNLELSYTYNADNDDLMYGLNPPAVGFTLLHSPVNKNILPAIEYGMTSCISPYKYIPCESDPNGEPKPAYLMLSGFKKDSTAYLDPTVTPYKKTKFTYTGEPEGNLGWTAPKGTINNCGLDSTGTLVLGTGFDKKTVMGSGSDNLEIAPGDTQRFVVAQMIARGSSNLNSVTVLKNLCRSVRDFYNSNFPFVVTPVPVITYPATFLLDQNYPNPFNATTRIKFHIPKINGSTSGTVRVVLKIYDLLGREVKTLINGDYSAQDYEVIFDGKNFASGMYFYKMTAGGYSSVKRMVLIK